MSTAVRSNFFRETMPQTVPSVGFNASFCDYSTFTTDFDLSLLPASPESEVPLSPTSLSPYSYLYPSSPPMFSPNLDHERILCDNLSFINVKAKITSEVKDYFESEPLNTPVKKSPEIDFFADNLKEEEEKFDFVVKEEENSSESTLIPTTVQTTANSYYSIDIKQEPSFGSDFGRSDFQTNPGSPYGIKVEKTIDLEEALDESNFLESSVKYEVSDKRYTTLRSLLRNPGAEKMESTTEAKSDHQLLRSVLRDTSFQSKFNLKPFDLPKNGVFEASQVDVENVKMERESGVVKTTEAQDIVEGLTSEKIEPVFSLAIEQIRRDVDNTCSVLGISKDPTRWVEEDVKAWLLWTVRQFALPMINPDCFKMDGATFCQLSEEDFQQRAPQSSSTLHAHLEIWKAAASCGDCSKTQNQDLSTVQWSPTMHSSGSSTAGDLSEDEDEEMNFPSSPQEKSGTCQTKQATTSAGKTKESTSGTHIHLWQFLKELLASPQAHESCIRWLDRQKGVFKIEDSVRVARLWGKRKNRPAMNYDKLSRSIRQYYKKGIMKKTERSQRLVYQFCHPYSL